MKNQELIKKAYGFSKERHKGQKRFNGEDYFNHLRNVYKILLRRKADYVTLCGALLHDLVEDTDTKLGEIKKYFGKEIAYVVDGMTKVKGLGNYLRKFEKYVKKDRRVLLVKIADLEENTSMLEFINVNDKARVKEFYTRFISIIKGLVKTDDEKEWIKGVEKKAEIKFKSLY